MPDIQLHLYTLTQVFEDGAALAESLGFHEVACYGQSRRANAQVRSQVEQLIEQIPSGDLHHRNLPVVPEVSDIKVEIPASPDNGWGTPIELLFPFAHWRHDDSSFVAYVPSLLLYVVANHEMELRGLVREEIRFALSRFEPTLNLRQLVELQRCEKLDIRDDLVELQIDTPREAAIRVKELAESTKSALEETGEDLGKQRLGHAYEVDETVARLAEALSGSQAQSVLLVGPSGVGKTAIFHELVRRRNDFEFPGVQFWSTSGSRLVAGMSGFGMWQQRCERLLKEVAEKPTILHVGALIELTNVGQSTCSQQSIGGFLSPYLMRRQMIVVAECTAEQIALLERQAPQLLNAFCQLPVEEPSTDMGRSILLSCALEMPHRVSGANAGPPSADSPIEAEALETLDRLHRRYATYSAYPGRPLRFLRDLLHDRPRGEPVSGADVTRRFSQETGLPRFLLEDEVRMDLDETRQWFARRLIGQDSVIDLVIDMLAIVKAGLTRIGRPIASLLFIGPTGVGKTEMAKLLAEFLYQSRDRMIRIDMSEYADSLAIERLVGGFGGEGLLTSQLREQPFSVILLDEFEKAHPAFFDLLLQVLGEGRLTDATGRVANFCNSVVIMTSNLGVDSFRPQAMGFAEGGVDAEEHFTRHVRELLRPELFNRIDRIAPFAPLSKAAIEQIALRELDRIRDRDGIKFRGVTLDVSEPLISQLAQAGYDPRYGARPLQHEIERRLLAVVADKLNGYSGDTAVHVTAELSGQRVDGDSLSETDIRVSERLGYVHVKATAKLDGVGRKLQAWRGDSQGEDSEPSIQESGRITDLRRQSQRLESCTSVLEMRNEIYRLEQSERRRQKKKRRRDDDQKWTAEHARLAKLSRADQLIVQLREAVNGLEEEALLTLYGDEEGDWERMAKERSVNEETLKDALLTMFLMNTAQQNSITVAVFGGSSRPGGRRRVLQLAKSYHRCLVKQLSSCQFFHLKPYRPELDLDVNKGVLPAKAPKVLPTFHLEHRLVEGETDKVKSVDAYRVDPAKFWGEFPNDAIGLALQMQGQTVYPLLAAEEGAHEFRTANRRESCIVETTSEPIHKYEPPYRIERVFGVESQFLRRRYIWNDQLDLWETEDTTFPKESGHRDKTIDAAVAYWLHACFEHALQAILE